MTRGLDSTLAAIEESPFSSINSMKNVNNFLQFDEKNISLTTFEKILLKKQLFCKFRSDSNARAIRPSEAG